MSQRLSQQDTEQRRRENIARAMAWNKAHPANHKKANDAYRKRNPEKVNALAREWYAKNKVQRRAKTREWREKNPALHALVDYTSKLKRRYGITPEEYENLYAKQAGCCAACARPFATVGSGRRPHIDHAHDTGVVRGLLCHGCNCALGMLSDDLARVQALAKYLIKALS